LALISLALVEASRWVQFDVDDISGALLDYRKKSLGLIAAPWLYFDGEHLGAGPVGAAGLDAVLS
jgi:hypothetical protein